MKTMLRYLVLAIALSGCGVGDAGEIADRNGRSPRRAAGRSFGPAVAAATARLAAIRAATERFQDPAVALAEGYLRDPADMCVIAPSEGQPRQLGGMGIHFFRPDLLEVTGVQPRVSGRGTHTDFEKPGLLIYEPQPDGSLELVAVENLVFVDAWHEAGHSGPPTFLGNEYYLMHDNPETAADEAHGFEPHYELHVWLYRENPSGTFAQFNPNVTCDHHRGGRHED